jgi:hypothetical protein
MTVIVKSRTTLNVPPRIQRRASIKVGDELEFRVSGGIINIIPKLPTAHDEYTPAQRRIIDARLAEARKGPYYGPFESWMTPSNSCTTRLEDAKQLNARQLKP